MNKIILLLDSSNGIYIPHLFCKNYLENRYSFTIHNNVEQEIKNLANDNNVGSVTYWYDWEYICYNADITFDNIEGTFNLYQIEGDLFLNHSSVEYDCAGYPIDMEEVND